MQEWQYHVMRLEGEIDAVAKELNNAGFQGWELVAVSTLSASARNSVTMFAVFKRPLNL